MQLPDGQAYNPVIRCFLLAITHINQARGSESAGMGEESNEKHAGIPAPVKHPTLATQELVEADAIVKSNGYKDRDGVRSQSALLPPGVQNARILHMLFRCSEGVESSASRWRPREDELSKLYMSGEYSLSVRGEVQH